MRVPSRIAMAMALLCIGAGVKPAAAQNFNDRWSIIPKANAAEPNGPIAPPPVQSPEAADAPSPVPGVDAAAAQRQPNTRAIKRSFTGRASFYSYKSGKTASGASFNRDSLTAAHRSLPFGTRVRVTDVATRKSVTVTITDRGPRAPNRVLDLSLAAARSLGITDRGVVRVRAELL
jgi:rare lipoprotein A (peptidoglycan hydrolase)